MARHFQIPHKNAGLVFKETAIKHVMDTATLEQKAKSYMYIWYNTMNPKAKVPVARGRDFNTLFTYS